MKRGLLGAVLLALALGLALGAVVLTGDAWAEDGRSMSRWEDTWAPGESPPWERPALMPESRVKLEPPPPPPPVRYVKDMRVGDVRWVEAVAINLRTDRTCSIAGEARASATPQTPSEQWDEDSAESWVMDVRARPGRWVKVTRTGEHAFTIDISTNPEYVFTIPHGATPDIDFIGGCFPVTAIIDRPQDAKGGF